MNITSPKAEWLCTMCLGNASSPVGHFTRNREVSNALMAADRQGIQRAGGPAFPCSVLQRLWAAPLFLFLFINFLSEHLLVCHCKLCDLTHQMLNLSEVLLGCSHRDLFTCGESQKGNLQPAPFPCASSFSCFLVNEEHVRMAVLQ